MAYGDGAVVFKPLTGSLAVIGHELSHGVVQFSGGLVYRDPSGALNESLSEVFGALVEQRVADQAAAEGDWLIGSGGAWETAGHVWYDAMQTLNNPHATFADWASQTVVAARQRFGSNSRQEMFVQRAWRLVGLDLSV